MAEDIVQRGLNLQVEAEDLASETLAGLADQFDELQARAESVFEAMAMAGADAASSLASSAGLFAPEWISELEQLQQSADAAFSDMGAAAASGAAAMAGSASTFSDAWVTATDALKGSSDTAIGSLDSLEGQMGSTAETADATAGEISNAYRADALGLDAANGSLDALQGQMQETAGVAGETAGEINGAWGGDALGLDAANGQLATLQGSFDETAGAAAGDAETIAGAWSGDALGLDGAQTSLKTLGTQFSTTAADAESAAKKITESFSNTTLGLDSGKVGLGELDTQMDTAAATAKMDAGEISTAFAGAADTAAAGSGAGAAAAGAAAAGAGAGDVAGISFGKGGGFKLPIPSMSALMTGGITGAIGLGGTDIAMQQLEGLESFKALTGMDWTQTLTTSAAAKGVGLGQDQISRLIQRLDTNIGKLTQGAVLGATAEGTAVNLGFGREGVDPTTLRAVMNSLGGVGGASLAMKSLGLTPSQLTGMDAQQQLAIIAQRLGEIKNNTLKTAVTQELFGRGTDTAFLLQKFTQAEAEAQKNLPKGLAKDLQMTLGGGGDKSMIDLQENMFYLEVEMSASLLKMVPLLDKMVAFGAAHTKLLEEAVLALMGGGAFNKMMGAKLPGGFSLGGEITKILGSTAGKVVGGLGGAGALAKFGGGALDLAGYGAEALSSAMLPIGITAGMLANPDSMGNDTSAMSLAYQKLVAPHTGRNATFTAVDTEKAITEMAKVFGLNAKAMLADSFAEATLNPYAHNKSGATGAFQFMPSTWSKETGKLFGSAMPISAANNPYISAFVAAADMRNMGANTIKGGDLTMLRNMIGDLPGDVLGGGRGFEHPGAAGAQGDLSRGAPFLQAIDQDITSKTGPKIKAETDTLLLALVTAAEKHSKDFSTATDKGLLQTETYLRTHKGTFTTLGTDLLKGLEQGLAAEEPTLIGQAKRIAGELEQTIRAALKTHSPSEMTAEIGADLMAGLALGMERATPGVAAVAGRQALLAAGPLAASTGPASTGAAAAGAGPTIIIELDGRTLVSYVLASMHERTKLVTKFN